MYKLFLILFIWNILIGAALAQESKEEVALDSFEQCNNWVRHYCLTGYHNDAVNQKLLQLKKKGYNITTQLIRIYAQKTRPNSRTKPTKKLN